MRVVFVVVGKIKDRGMRDLIADYVERISHYAKVSEVELTDDDTVEARMRKAIPERARVVAMEVEGTRMTSPALARFVGQCESGAVPAIVFLIGGSYGLPKAISAEASLRLSLSDLTLPHRLARLLLVEQVYRAFTILRNEPYSH
ncbi:MAG: 23S rRNA (pseudouridine(1915)-N(3))-methyltransferase RlmH [Sandaracinus sp.]